MAQINNEFDDLKHKDNVGIYFLGSHVICCFADPTYKDLKNPNFDANVQAIDIIMPVTPGNFTVSVKYTMFFNIQ